MNVATVPDEAALRSRPSNVTEDMTEFKTADRVEACAAVQDVGAGAIIFAGVSMGMAFGLGGLLLGGLLGNAKKGAVMGGLLGGAFGSVPLAFVTHRLKKECKEGGLI